MAIYFIYNSTVCFAFQPDCYRNVLACHSEEQGILGLFISNYSLQACLFLGCFPFHLFS